MRKPSLYWLLIGLLAVSAPLKSEPLTFYTYHDKPPYVEIRKGTGEVAGGIYHSYAEYLNSMQKNVVVSVALLPRKRLEDTLNRGELSGAVIGVNPLWFKDKEKERYLWSDPMMVDQDIVVLRPGLKLEYNKPQDLTGLTLALPRGLYYWGITELANEGEIKLSETNGDVQDLKMLAMGRVDGTIMSDLTYKLVIREIGTHQLQVMKTPHDQFERMVLFPKSQDKQYVFLKDVIKKSFDDPIWRNKLKTFGYEAKI